MNQNTNRCLFLSIIVGMQTQLICDEVSLSLYMFSKISPLFILSRPYTFCSFASPGMNITTCGPSQKAAVVSSSSVSVHASMYLHVRLLSACAQWATVTASSELLGLAVIGHAVQLHMDATGLAAAHPAYGRAVKGRSQLEVVPVLQRGQNYHFVLLSVGHLEFHELQGLFKSAIGHGTPVSEGRVSVLFTEKHKITCLLKLSKSRFAGFCIGSCLWLKFSNFISYLPVK